MKLENLIIKIEFIFKEVLIRLITIMESFFTNLALSTITVESKISNIKFKEKELIEHLAFKNVYSVAFRRT